MRSHTPFSFPKGVAMFSSSIGLFSLFFFTSFIAMQFISGDAVRWGGGSGKGGDLLQYYAAGQLWQEGDISTLYQDHKFGEWVNNHSITPIPLHLTQFNFVYPPLVAMLSSKLVGLGYDMWIRLWLPLSVLSYLFIVFALKKKGTPPAFMLLLLGFPSFFYTLIPFQNSTVTLLIFILGAGCMNKGRELLGGLIVSCAFYKPQIFPYLVLFFLIAGHWRVALGILLGGGFWYLFGILLCGFHSHLLWFQSLVKMASGQQFIKMGHDQSWAALLGYSLPAYPAIAVKIISQGIGFSLLAIGAVFTRHSQVPISTGAKLYLAVTLWLLASPYVGFYEPLLAVAWWAWIILHVEWSLKKKLLVCLLWGTSLFSITGIASGTHLVFTAPLLTVWTLGTLHLLVCTPKSPSR